MRSAMKVGGEVKGLCLECKAKGHWSLAQPIRSPDFKDSINSILPQHITCISEENMTTVEEQRENDVMEEVEKKNC